jgi:hypothetical protein
MEVYLVRGKLRRLLQGLLGFCILLLERLLEEFFFARRAGGEKR